MITLKDYVSDQSRQAEDKFPGEYLKFVLNEYNYGYHSVIGKVEFMNYSTAVFLINDQVRAIYATYEPDRSDQKARRYLFKTFDKNIQVGDFITVPSTVRHLLDIARVTAVDVDIDMDSATNVDWIVSVIDMSDFLKTCEEERAAVALLKQAQMSEKRDKLATTLHKHQEKLKALPLSRRAKEDADS